MMIKKPISVFAQSASEVDFRALTIGYAVVESLFGKVLMAYSDKGWCYISFLKDKEDGEKQLFHSFPGAHFVPQQELLEMRLQEDFMDKKKEIGVHLIGTSFQLEVWQALLDLRVGETRTYKELATKVGNPSASRAVGTAIGKNKLAFLVPCHRIIKGSGELGGYRWQTDCKKDILIWEAQRNGENENFLPFNEFFNQPF